MDRVFLGYIEYLSTDEDETYWIGCVEADVILFSEEIFAEKLMPFSLPGLPSDTDSLSAPNMQYHKVLSLTLRDFDLFILELPNKELPVFQIEWTCIYNIMQALFVRCRSRDSKCDKNWVRLVFCFD